MEYRILGPIEVVTAAGPLVLGGPKQRALLGVLLLDAGRAVSTDRLAAALWGTSLRRPRSTSSRGTSATCAASSTATRCPKQPGETPPLGLPTC